MCFYILLSGLLPLASSHLSLFSWHPQAPLTTAESISGMMKVITNLTEKDSGSLLDWEGKNIPWWLRNSSCVSFTLLSLTCTSTFLSVCGLSEKNVSNSYSSIYLQLPKICNTSKKNMHVRKISYKTWKCALNFFPTDICVADFPNSILAIVIKWAVRQWEKGKVKKVRWGKR